MINLLILKGYLLSRAENGAKKRGWLRHLSTTPTFRDNILLSFLTYNLMAVNNIHIYPGNSKLTTSFKILKRRKSREILYPYIMQTLCRISNPV